MIHPLSTQPSRADIAYSSYNREFFALVFVAIATITYFLAVNPYEKTALNLGLGVVIIVTGLTPLALWLKRVASNPIPVLEMHGAFYAVCFGLAGFVRPSFFMGSISVSEEEYVPALTLSLLSLLCLFAGYRAGLNWRPSLPRLRALKIIDAPSIDRTAVLYIFPAALIARELAQKLELGMLSMSLGAVHTFAFIWVLYAAWKGRLGSFERNLVLWIYLPLDVGLNMGLVSGKLAGLLIYSQLLVITYSAAKNRILLSVIILFGTLFFLLQPIKGDYRAATWGIEDSQRSSADNLAYFLRLGVDHYSGGGSEDYLGGIEASYTRVNHLHTMAAIVADTPRISDFKGGETYVPLLTKWIPRVLWPEKPIEDLGNRWARDYLYLGDEDSITSFNLPWLPEMYMNFGTAGVILISGLVGLLMAIVWIVFAEGAKTPIHFAVGMTLCSSFFFPESNLSIAIGDMIVAVIVLVALVMTINSVYSRSVQR